MTGDRNQSLNNARFEILAVMLLEFSGIWCQIVGSYSQDNSALLVRYLLDSNDMLTLIASITACFFRVSQLERKLLFPGVERAVTSNC
jgi:hypothetical protein